MKRIPAISIRLKLISLCIGLVTIPSVILGILSYNTLKEQTYRNIEKDLRIISTDWQKITKSYIEQMQRVLKREEVLVQQRLKSVAKDVELMLESFREVHGDILPAVAKNILFDRISRIKIGRSGYVALLDVDGNYLLSKDRLYDGENLLEKDETKATFMRNVVQALQKLESGDHHLMHYKWAEAGYGQARMKMSALSYFEPWQLIISVNIYYSDFKSYEIEKKLKDDLKHKMADQRIGVDGYIWVVNSAGEYMVSRDLLRDGENISGVRDEKGRLIIQEVISIAKALKPEESAVYYYAWRNLGEPHAYEKLAGISYVPEWDWVVAASAYHKDFLQGLKIIRINIIKVCASAILIGSIIAYFSALLISKPIKQLQEKSIQASKGDLHAEIDQKIVARKDEIGSLAKAFNTMIVNLKALIKQQEKTNVEMSEAKERAEMANAAKSDFLARMSHEIRTPLNAVTGLTHIILKSELTTEQRDYLNKVKIASSNLLEVINDILDFSKVEAGRLELSNAPFNLDQVIERLADLFSSRAAQKDLELIFAISPRAPRQLVGDASRLTQILTNLVENAVKFTDKGEVVLEVGPDTRAPAIQGQTALNFRVRDTGSGIAADILPSLFEPFSQADSYLTRKHEGTGLGLAICQKLVEMMGGTIEAQSAVDQGSSFSFTVRFQVQPKERPRFNVPEDLHGLKVLVVDDSASARQMLEDLLASLKFNVSSVDNGESAIEAIHEAQAGTPYQMVLLDWKMPGMDGIETAATIRNNSSVTRLPIIIMVTAYSREQVQERIEATAVDGLLLKPIKPSQLFDTIVALFSQKMDVRPQVKHNSTTHHVRLAGSRVLLVEDSDLNRDVAEALLKDAGLIVESAENGQVAVDKVVQAPHGYYDAIFMDIQMPVMDGYQATKMIKTLEKKRAKGCAQTESSDPDVQTSIPIIALTAHALTGEKEKCLISGMDDYLSKPIDEQELHRVLLKWILPQREETIALNYLQGEEVATGGPVLNVECALKRLGGRKQLYINVIQKFEPECGKALETITMHLANGDREAARRLAHTIKGTAAAIGAEDLRSAAAQLELSIRDDGPDVEALLNRFKGELTQALKAIDEFLQHNQRLL